MNVKTCLLSLAALVAVPTVASAQTVTSDCYFGKKRVHCYSTVRPSLSQTISEIIAINGSQRDTRHDAEIDAWIAKRLAAQREKEKAANLPDYQRWMIGEFIVNNNCPAAHRYARETGDPAMVKRAEEFCGKELASGPQTPNDQTGPTARHP